MEPSNVILVIDDNPDNIFIIQQLLSEFMPEYKVISTDNAADGLHIAETSPIDLALIDVQIPSSSGIEICRRLKEKEIPVAYPIILITAHKSTPGLRAEGLKAGAEDFISKPIDNAEFIAKIQAMLRIKKAEDYLRQANANLEKIVDEKTKTLYETKTNYRRLLENLNEGVWEIDKDSNTTFVNPLMAEMLQYTIDEMAGKPLCSFMDEEGKKILQNNLERRKKGIKEEHDFEFIKKDGTRLYARLNTSPITDQNGNYNGAIAGVIDITERKKTEKKLYFTHKILEISNFHTNLHLFLQEILTEFKRFTGCSAVGIRLLDEHGNIPYQTYDGFDKTFYEKESPLSIHSDSCMCINVIKGKTNPQLPFYTPGGSFYMNGASRFLASVSEEDKGKTRNVCNQVGYESVALIPIREGSQIAGLIHLADTKENKVPLDVVQIIEDASAYMGIVIRRLYVEEFLVQSENRYRSLYEDCAIPIWEEDFSKVKTYFDDLRSSGIQDIRAYFNDHPKAVAHCASLIEILSVNQENLSFFKVNTKEEIPKNLSHYLTEESLVIFKEELIALAEGKLKFESERPLRNLQGEIRNVIFRLSVVTGSLQTLSRVLVSFVDITDHKKTEEKLNQEQEFTRALLDNITEGVVACDAEGNLVLFNQMAREWHGIDAAALPAEEWASHFDLYCGDGKTPLPTELIPLRRAFLGENVHDASMAIVAKGQQPRYILASGSPIIDTHQKKLGAVAVMHDITKQKRMEEALRESEAFYQSLVENIPQYIIRKDLQGRFTFANPIFCIKENKSLEEILGKTDFDLYPAELAQKYQKDDRTVIETGKPFESIEENLLSNGQKSSVHISKTPVWNQEGEIIGIQGIFRDITEQQKMEEQLRQSQKMEAIGQLAGGIAHDFNNILGVIIGCTDLVLMKIQPDDGENRQYLTMIQMATERAKNLVKQILTFSRKSEISRKPIILSSLVKEATTMLRASLPTTIEIRQNIAAEKVLILADATQIHQVLMNLCTNAAHAMQERGGLLEINLFIKKLRAEESAANPDLQPGNYAYLIISDTGFGIDPSIQERIFDPFFTTKDKSEGTGLGLSVVLGIVKSHNGSITFKSTPGKGTTFTVLLPIIESEFKEEKPDSSLMKGGKEHILLVDDEIELLRIGEKMLNMLGYHVTAKSSSLEALETFRAEPNGFDLILTDLTMPKMTGMQLAQEIIKIRGDMPIILNTGYNKLLSEEKAKLQGIQGTILKPYRPHELNQLIRKILDQPKLT